MNLAELFLFSPILISNINQEIEETSAGARVRTSAGDSVTQKIVLWKEDTLSEVYEVSDDLEHDAEELDIAMLPKLRVVDTSEEDEDKFCLQEDLMITDVSKDK